MSEKNNKVKYNLKNAHYALLTIGEDGTVTYGSPTALPGSVSLSLDANGEPENFYADGIAYYVINNNMGYDGDLELALIPESFRTEVLKEKLDAKGVLIEDADAELAQFALLFEFDGDVRHIRHVMYNCSASRPKIEGKTNEDKKEVQTETLTIKSTPLADGKVKAKTGNTTDATVYANWYKAVYLPVAVEAASLQKNAGEKVVADTGKTEKGLN
nr:MAG TPA: tail tube protein [Caudoviricetes sp.]